MAEPAAAPRTSRRWPIYVVFAVFVAVAAWILYDKRHELGHALSQLSWGAIVASFAAAVVAVAALLMSWISAVRDGGAELELRDGVRIYAIGQVGKYIPGSVWPVLAQAGLARRRGISPLRVASGSLLALAVSVCAAMAFGGVLLPFADHSAARRLWWAPVAGVLCLALLYPRLLNRLLGFAAKVLRRGEVTFSFSLGGILRCAGWCVLGNVFFGLHIFFLAHSLGASGFRGFILSVCAYSLASAIGVAIIFLPAGSGARETVLTLVLAPVLTSGAALAVALVSRAILVVVDVGFGLSQVRGLHRWGQDGPAAEVPVES